MSEHMNIWKVNDWPELGLWFKSRPVQLALWTVGFFAVQLPMHLTAPSRDEVDSGDIPLAFIISALSFVVVGFMLLGFGMPVMIAVMRCAGFKK